MNKLRNKVQLIGRLGQDPEIVNLESGKKLAKFSLAINENYKNANGEKVESTQWHTISAWGATATLIEKYLSKGQEVAIEGKLNNKKFEDKTGTTRYVTEIVANEIQMFGKNASA